ncbi:MAG: hypothetical protein KJO07_17775, partial [Deltaproteobacteria bacterium]|nr:hypothetical protein [Deltaproteobacteria bacterium]
RSYSYQYIGRDAQFRPELASAVCLEKYKPFVDDRSLQLDAAGLQACSDFVTTVSCTNFRPDDMGACVAVFRGQTPKGGFCQVDEQCAGASHCRRLNGCGVCDDLAMELSYCADHSDCTTGYCNGQLCRQWPGVGDPCIWSENCDGDLICVDDVCAPPPVLGDDCIVAQQYVEACGWPDSGLFCQASTAKCVAESEVGEPCDLDYVEYSCNLSKWLWCDDGICAAPTLGGEGMTCDFYEVPAIRCDEGLQCLGSEGICQIPPSIGEPCVGQLANICDPPLVCVAATCQVPMDAPDCSAI